MATPEAKPVLRPVGKRIEVPIKKASGPGDDKIHTWPHLVRNEFLISIGIILLLIVWSLLVDAPLDETVATIVGATVVVAYFVVGYLGFYLFCRRVKGAEFPDFIRRWGWPRFYFTGFLFLNMMAVVFKMLGRHLINLKYIMVLKTPYCSINI